jgi:hypothetical protein
VPKGERWIHQIKLDGYRVQLHIANESAKVLTRNGLDRTGRFQKVADDAFLINAPPPLSAAFSDTSILPPVSRVAGFSPDEITITAEQSVLTVEGRKAEKQQREFLL